MKSIIINYLRMLLELFSYEDAGKGDSQEAEVLREQMIKIWYTLTLEERNVMDELAEKLKKEML